MKSEEWRVKSEELVAAAALLLELKIHSLIFTLNSAVLAPHNIRSDTFEI